MRARATHAPEPGAFPAAPKRRRDIRTGNQAQGEFLTLVSTMWWITALGIVASGIAAAIASRTIPGPLSATMFVSALGLIGLAQKFRAMEMNVAGTLLNVYLLMITAVGLPMFITGIGLSRWMIVRGAGIPEITAATLAITATALMALQGRLPSIILALVLLWAGRAAMFEPLVAVCAVLITLPGVYWLTSRHLARREERRLSDAEENRLRERAEELLHEYEYSGQGWFFETDRHGAITYVSPHIARMLGRGNDEIVGMPFTSMFILSTKEKESERTLNFHLSTRSSFADLGVQAATDEAEARWWSVTGRPVHDKFNNFLGFRGWGADLTETRKSQQHVTELARFDSLTKLANRFQMSEWVEKILNATQVDRRACGIFLLDLDRFKQVNDTMGHPAGDALLKQVAERLRSTVGEAGSVGRLGGDEFQVLLPGHHSTETLQNLANRIIENLSQPYSIEGNRVIIGASVGIAVCPDHGTTSEELIRNADLALYAAKDGGRGRHFLYADDLHSEAEERRELEEQLRDAIGHGELELHYQPQVNTMSERISGFEALIRWRHPVKGYLSPAKFVPVAEESGLIDQMGEWALRTACAELARWPAEVRCAVNVSPLQFANPSLPNVVTSAIVNSGIDPKRLELEITESVFLNDDSQTEKMFAALKGIGVRLALDDFGTGYSSLGYLKKAPFDKIKIDQSFVRGATMDGTRNAAIISSIVTLAESLSMETIAEGVETLDELDLIRSLGCSHIQGYIYEKPLTSQDANDRLASGLHAIARGPRSARPPRQTMLRKVMAVHGEHRYKATIRNISQTGALVEGLWNVPPGTHFELHLARGYAIGAISRWSRDDRMGMEFDKPLAVDDTGAIIVNPPVRAIEIERPLLRKAG